MKYGIRKPNIKKRIKARTTGKLKRQVKKSINPLYGKHGMGVVNDPKKAMYNKIYNKTTVSIDDIPTCTQKENNSINIFQGIGAFFQFLFGLFQVIFWLAIFVAIIAFVITLF